MEVIAAVAASAIASACQHAVLGSWLANICPQRDYVSELGERLSRNAHIYIPGSDDFATATTRWSAGHNPDVKLVVVPSIENDVAETVKYANELGMPFLALSGGHGAIKTVGRMKGGIQIWLHQLNSVEISEDGTQAKIGGGAKTKEVVDALWAGEKQTVTGLCECTSILGPGLGGGHGILQGHHGLVSDQFLSMNIVLADGSLRTIDESSDLWWAMQGAGHNFGIVTSVTMKIYELITRDWTYESFIYTGDKVEALYEHINEHLMKDGSQPIEILHYSFFFNNPEIDPNNPLIMFFILEEGNMVVNPTYTTPFHKMGPIAVDGEPGIYKDIAEWTSNGKDSPACQKAGMVNYRFPIDVESYNIPAQRQVYDLFASATKETPALNGSFFLFEGFGTQGVKAIPSESTAYPSRSDNLLISPVINYAGDDAELDKKAVELGENLRRILHEATGREEMHTYVNYAYGEETKENMYGYEQWRQDRLLELKNKYDPQRKFSFYAPIA